MSPIPRDLFPAYPRPTHILEIGAGRFEATGGIWTPTIERMTLEPDQSYLGIDIGAASPGNGQPAPEATEELDARMRAYWASIRAARPNEHIHFEQMDARDLPYNDETFDRVIASNLYAGGAPDDALVDIYRQSDRVLTQDGELVIHDDHTPYFHSRNTLVQWFGDNGMALAEEPRRIMPTRTAYARYGLPTYDLNGPDSLRQPTLRDRFEQSTLWILGKSAFTHTIE